jgi:ABC-type uncharacterized transport system involved in gliding motility auxiliary subunit
MATTSYKRFTTGALGLACLLVITGAIYVIVSNLRIRADLTAEKLYTLSKGSRELLSKLPKDVTLKFYFSRSSAEMPMMLKTYADQVCDLLKEYELASGGRLVLEEYDPKPDSDSEEWAQRYGVEPQQTSMLGQPVYFGLVAVSGDNQQVMAGLNPRTEATLEYDVTRLITRVAWPEKPVIGVMSSLSVLGQPMNPMMMQRQRQKPDQGWMVFQELKKDYTVREVEMETDAIAPDITTLVVIHPKNLADKTLFALDQFVLRGGRLIALVDPFSLTDFAANQQQQNPMMMQMGGGGQAGPSTLGKLFTAWGVTFDTTKVVADLSAATQDNPAALTLTSENAAKDELLTANLSQILLPFSGSFTFADNKDILVTPLLRSSNDKSCLVDQMNAQFGMGAMRAQLKPDGVQRTLAARLQGKFTSAFPNGLVEEGSTNAPLKGLTTGNGNMMLFADADFINDPYCFRVVQSLFGNVAEPFNENMTLFGNTVEQLAGRQELIGVRSRGNFNRPFTKVDRLEATAMKKWQVEEETLQQRLQETQQRLSELQQQKKGTERMILSREQQAEIEQFRKTQADTRKQLKNVRKSLNHEIEQLGLQLKVVNIALVPFLVICVGIWRGVQRKKQR